MACSKYWEGIMNNYITIPLLNGLFNAGVLGLHKLLEYSGYSDYQIKEQEISVNKDFFLKHDFATLYLDMIFECFEVESSFYSFINTDYDKVDDSVIKKINILKQKTPLTVCEIYGNIEFPRRLQEINQLSNIEDKKLKIKETQQYLIENKDIYRYLVIGDVTRSILGQYFGTFAFLENKHKIRTKDGQNFESSLDDFLFDKLRKYIENIESYEEYNPKHAICFECRNTYTKTKKDFVELKFLNDFVDDPDKKKSVFWNNASDALVCPLCAFIYALMPFGFIPVARGTYSKDRLFINSNDSIDGLISTNLSVSREKEMSLKNNKFVVLNTIVEKEIAEKQREIDNIELIFRHCYEKKSFYSFDIIGKDILEGIKKSQKNLQDLITKRVKNQDEWIDVFNKVLNNILSYQNQWDFLYTLFKLEANIYVLNNVFQIQINQNSIKEGRNSMKEVDGKIKSAKLSGIELQKYFGKEAENKLRSYIYKLVNALSVGNKEIFLDTVIRMYSGINKEIPNTFINLFAGDESFKEIGYAYLLGLKSEFKNEKEE